MRVGRDAYCHWLPALLGGHLVRQHLELAVSEPGGDMAFRGVFFAEEQEHLDAFAVDLHETGPSGGDVHWRGAATGESRASFEGLIQIDPGAQQTHTYLQIHTMMLSPKARIDAIPSVLVSSDDVSASHGGTVGELDESSIFYMQTPRPGPRGGGADHRRGLLRAADLRARGRAAAGAGAREDRRRSWRRRARTSRRMPPVAESRLSVRADFPIFERRLGRSPLVYLDSGATSQKPRVVIDALAAHLARTTPTSTAASTRSRRRPTRRSIGARADRRVHRRRAEDDDLHQERDRGDQPRGAAPGAARTSGPGDAVLITQMEHHANLVPWQQLCRERGAQLRYLEVDERGELSLAQLDAELARGDVRLVAFAHVSNVLGTINPVAEIAARARAAGAVTLVDGAQAVPQMPVDVEALGADFYAWTGHKALGPTGIGVLHGRRELLEAMDPFLTGGDMIASVDFDRRRPGTSCRSSSRRARRRSPRPSASAPPSTTSPASAWSACARTSAS